MERKGFVIGGTLIVDEVKIIETYPNEGTLIKILATSKGVGGCPTNNSINLKTLDPDVPVAVVGRIGNDENGRYVLERLQEKGVDTHAVSVSAESPTSYTDVMTAKRSGQRTFFHDVGANAEWTVAHIPFEDFAGYKIAQIGYILLLDGMDAADPDYGTVMARAFGRFQQMGLKTSVDVVSEMSDRFTRLVIPALQYVDYLILNELEAGQTVGVALRDDAGRLRGERLRDVAEKLLAAGKSELVVIHMPEGGYALNRSGQEVKVPSYQISEQEIQGSVGAGDAFCSGVLYGLEQEKPLEECLRIGTMLAACNLFSPTATGGALPLAAAQERMRAYQLRPLAF